MIGLGFKRFCLTNEEHRPGQSSYIAFYNNSLAEADGLALTDSPAAGGRGRGKGREGTFVPP